MVSREGRPAAPPVLMLVAEEHPPKMRLRHRSRAISQPRGGTEAEVKAA